MNAKYTLHSFGEFCFGSTLFNCNDPRVFQTLSSLYNLELRHENAGIPTEFTFNVLSTDGAHYLEYRNHKKTCLDVAEVLGFVDEAIDYAIKAHIPTNRCLLHASSCLVDGSAISCIGLSGSGKTTLSIAIAQREGTYLGDEYALVDLSVGSIRHERGPIRVKEISHPLASQRAKGFRSVDSRDIISYAHKPSSFDLILSACKEAHPLGMIIVPSYDSSIDSTTMKPIALRHFVDLLPSMAASDITRGELLRRFIALVSSHRIPVIAVRYRDCIDAAQRIIAFFRAIRRNEGGDAR